MNQAIAAVEALRARVADLKADYLRRHKDACDRFEKLIAAEAHMAALAGAISAWLDHRHDVFCAQMQGTFDEMPTNRIDEIVQQCEDALSATPADAMERAKAREWQPIAEKHPPAHETVLFLCSNDDIYQGRGCYGMHEPWWCGHSKLNFGKVLEDAGLTVTHWKPREDLAKLDTLKA